MDEATTEEQSRNGRSDSLTHDAVAPASVATTQIILEAPGRTNGHATPAAALEEENASDVAVIPSQGGGGGNRGNGRRGIGGGGGGGNGWRDRDLTNGSIPRNLWNMSWPQATEGVMRVVDQMLDLIWAGFLGTPHIAGIGVAQQYTQVAWTARQGIFTAQRAMVSRAIGMGDLPLARLSVYQAATVTFAFWLVIAAIGIIFTEPLLSVLGVPETVVDKAVPYMRIQFAGQGFMAFQQLSTHALVASGDPMTPMKSQIISRICHAILSPILVFGPLGLPGLGIAGAALAASTGNGLAAAFNCRALFTGRSRLHLRFSEYRVEPKLIWQILRLGGPAAVNGAERSVAQLVMVVLVTPFGANALAAFTLSRRVEMFANLGSQGFGQASGVIVGQNLGANKPERARRTILCALSFVLGIKGTLATLLFIFPSVFLSLFTRDPELLDLASAWIRIQCIGYLAMGAQNVFQQSFMTAGATIWPMFVTLFALWGIELPLAYVLSHMITGEAVSIAYASLIASFSRPALHLPYFLSNRWMRARVFGHAVDPGTMAAAAH